MRPVPVLLLTGFLGSGKTTILNRLLRDPAFRETAIVINEAGDVGLDHLLVEAGEEDVVLLEGGCLCCRMRGSLAGTLAGLLRRRASDGTLPFARIVVETSGLADPAPILQGLISDAGFTRRFALAGIVTVVDAATFARSLAGNPEVAMQVAFADRLLVTKRDLVAPAELPGLERALRRLNGYAPVHVVPPEDSTAPWFWTDALALRERLPRPVAMASATEAGSEVATASLAFPGRLQPDLVEDWLEHTIGLFGPELLRLKALLHLDGERRAIVLHAVGGLVHLPEEIGPERLEGPAENRVVLIGRGVESVLLRDAVDRLAAAAVPETIDKPRLDLETT